MGKVPTPPTSSLFSPLVQPLRQTAAWSRCRKGPVQTMFCCGTSTLAQGNAGRLCTAAAGATRTASPRGRSARGGVGRRGEMEGTNQVVNRIGKVMEKNFFFFCFAAEMEEHCWSTNQFRLYLFPFIMYNKRVSYFYRG